MPWIHVAVPVVLATAGLGAGAAALLTDEPPSSAAVWIDAPSRDGVVEPGDVAVVAHASATDDIDGLALIVDGREVDTDTALDRRGRLVYGELSWRAEVGEHEIAVQQVGGADVRSQAVWLSVVGPGDDAPRPTPTPSDETPTPTPTEETIDPDLDPGVDPTGDVMIGDVGFDREPRVSTRASCGDSVLAYAQVSGADRVFLEIQGLRRIEMSTARGEQWSATIDSGWELDDVGSHSVTVVVPVGDSEIVKDVGQLTIQEGCV